MAIQNKTPPAVVFVAVDDCRYRLVIEYNDVVPLHANRFIVKTIFQLSAVCRAVVIVAIAIYSRRYIPHALLAISPRLNRAGRAYKYR